MINQNQCIGFLYNISFFSQISDKISDKNAFSYNNLTSIQIPDSVKQIKSSAFNGNKLNTVVIGTENSSIQNIDYYAFGEGSSGAYGPNQLTDVTIYSSEDKVSIDEDAFNI